MGQRGESIVEIASARMSTLLKEAESNRIDGIKAAVSMANRHWERAREGFAKISYSTEVLGTAFSESQIELKDELSSDYNKLIDRLEIIAERQENLREGRFSVVLGGSLLFSDLSIAILNMGHNKANPDGIYTIVLSIGFVFGGMYKIKKSKKEDNGAEKR